MRADVIAFSAMGEELGEKVRAFLEHKGMEATLTRCPKGGLVPWTAERFASAGALVFIGSCGLAVRAIAPHVRDKTADPAVIVLDESGSYAISLLSGHIGGANALTAQLAKQIGAIPVITTATDVRGLFAVDAWAKRQGLAIANPERIKWVSARLLAGEVIRIKSLFPVEGSSPKGTELGDEGYDVLITYRTRGRTEALRLVPPVVTLGVGCRRDVPVESIERAFEMTLGKAGCHPLAVTQVCSVDLKADEPGLLEFCRRRNLPFRTFPARELARVKGEFVSSAFVQSVTGVDNVCERSAVLGSGGQGRLISRKDAGCGVAMALAIAPYTVAFGGWENV